MIGGNSESRECFFGGLQIILCRLGIHRKRNVFHGAKNEVGRIWNRGRPNVYDRCACNFCGRYAALFVGAPRRAESIAGILKKRLATRYALRPCHGSDQLSRDLAQPAHSRVDPISRSFCGRYRFELSVCGRIVAGAIWAQANDRVRCWCGVDRVAEFIKSSYASPFFCFTCSRIRMTNRFGSLSASSSSRYSS